MNNNYNGFYPYGNFMRSVPTNYANSFRSVPNYMYAPATRSTGGLLSRLFSGGSAATGLSAANTATTGGITFSGILNGASKTLGVINQAIPVFYQVKPIWNNAKTMFRVAKAMNSNDNKTNNTYKKDIIDSNTNQKSIETNEGPTFFN